MGYQLVPYLLSVGVRGNATEQRLIGDLDTKGASLHNAVAKIAAASRERHFTDPGNAARRLELSALHRGEQTVFIEWNPGRSGIESSIRRHDGTVLPRSVKDTEFVPVRHVIFSPANSSYALLFAERVGTTGAMTMSSKLLKDTFGKYYPDLRLDIEPAVTTAVLQKMIEDQPIKTLIFTRPRPGDVSGRFAKVAGESVELEVRMRPARRRWWNLKGLPTEGESQQVTAASLLGVLAPQLRPDLNEQDAVNSLLEDGWEPSLQVKFKGGAQRQVNMATAHSTTMSFPIIPEEEDQGPERPTDEQFRDACASVLQLFIGQYSLDERSPASCRWAEAEWQDEGDAWEVQWDEPDAPQPAPA